TRPRPCAGGQHAEPGSSASSRSCPSGAGPPSAPVPPAEPPPELWTPRQGRSSPSSREWPSAPRPPRRAHSGLGASPVWGEEADADGGPFSDCSPSRVVLASGRPPSRLIGDAGGPARIVDLNGTLRRRDYLEPTARIGKTGELSLVSEQGRPIVVRPKN